MSVRKNTLLIFILFSLLVSCQLDDSISYNNEDLLSGKWQSYDMPNDWKYRDGATLIEFNSKLLLLGGWTYEEPYEGGTVVSEVWESPDGFSWKQLPDAPWPPRHGMAVAIHKNKIFILGGDELTDVWSTIDGINWICENSNLPFEGRYTPHLVSLNGKLITYGGVKFLPGDCVGGYSCICMGFDDIWSSMDGKVWEKISDAPWDPRGLIHNSIVFNDEIYIIGGGLKQTHPVYPVAETSSEFSDVWKSKDGINWQLVTSNYGFPSRTHFSVLSAFDAIWISDGSIGNQANVSNDLFFSRDGIKFLKVDTPNDMPKRHASSFVQFKNNLIILGGPPTDSPRGKVYVYTIIKKD